MRSRSARGRSREVLPGRRNGSPVATDLESFESRGPRIKDLDDLFVTRFPDPIRNYEQFLQIEICELAEENGQDPTAAKGRRRTWDPTIRVPSALSMLAVSA